MALASIEHSESILFLFIVLVVTSSVPVGSGTVPGSSRTYLVANPVPPSTIIPVAKVLPQPVASTASAIRSRFQLLIIKFIISREIFFVTDVSAASINLSGASSVNETSHSAVTTGTGLPIQVASRSSSGMFNSCGTVNYSPQHQFLIYSNRRRWRQSSSPSGCRTTQYAFQIDWNVAQTEYSS